MEVACSTYGEEKRCNTVLVGKTKDLKIIRKFWHRRPSNIKMNLKRIWMGLRIDCSVTGLGQMVGCFERGYELAGFHKMQELLEYPSNCWLLKKDCFK
jgi:hypothetical protein